MLSVLHQAAPTGIEDTILRSVDPGVLVFLFVAAATLTIIKVLAR
jgi:hypothetical protein